MWRYKNIFWGIMDSNLIAARNLHHDLKQITLSFWDFIFQPWNKTEDLEISLSLHPTLHTLILVSVITIHYMQQCIACHM